MAHKLVRIPSREDLRPLDPPFRWLVRSRTSSIEYLVDFSAYRRNGRCSCPDFELNLAPFLNRGMNGEDAVAAGAADLRDYHRGPWDALRCYHICEGLSLVMDLTLEKEIENRKTDAPPPA